MFKKGFTLLELLIVIAIMGILASVVLIQGPQALEEARDSQRLQDMTQIVTALKVYKANHGRFPEEGSDACCDSWDQGPCNGDNDFIHKLIEEGTIKTVPVDSQGKDTTGCYGYTYYRYSAGYDECDPDKGAFFVIGVRDLESTGRPHPQSPGWSCPGGRDWQDEFDWVTGAFENPQ